MATKKAAGAAKNFSKPLPKYRGLKVGNGEFVNSGQILIRQKGSKYYPGLYTDVGRDFTIFAIGSGHVKFYDGFKDRKFVTVVPENHE
jgi:large subunit ribosomal protein L27